MKPVSGKLEKKAVFSPYCGDEKPYPMTVPLKKVKNLL